MIGGILIRFSQFGMSIEQIDSLGSEFCEISESLGWKNLICPFIIQDCQNLICPFIIQDCQTTF